MVIKYGTKICDLCDKGILAQEGGSVDLGEKWGSYDLCNECSWGIYDSVVKISEKAEEAKKLDQSEGQELVEIMNGSQKFIRDTLNLDLEPEELRTALRTLYYSLEGLKTKVNQEQNG